MSDDIESLRRALTIARNRIAFVRKIAKDTRTEMRGHVCPARKALDAVHDVADDAVRFCDGELGIEVKR